VQTQLLPLASVPSEIRDAGIVLISCEQRTGGSKHPRSFGRGDKVYDPWHYVPVLALVDVAVVYKVDRRTRALADFAKIVEVFDRQGVSFVSVTQQFNTATSMGRLTLNVLSAGPPTRSSGSTKSSSDASRPRPCGLRRDRRHAVLGAACLRPDQHAQDRWLADLG
jgi:hypothetical protein